MSNQASSTRGVDNSLPARNINLFAQSPLNNLQGVMAARRLPLLANATTTQTIANPLFGRPIWTYVQVAPGAARGPQPRLARGTGLTGDPSLPGNANRLPGFLSDQEYEPTDFTYAPPYEPTSQVQIPRTIKTGNNGRDVVGTYEPHDFTPGQRWSHHRRSVTMWQEMDFRPGPRNLLAWQQVQRFKIQTLTLSARPLSQDNYFLGYQVQPQTAASIGQSGLGYMGSQ
jgi:hypothetical protein